MQLEEILFQGFRQALLESYCGPVEGRFIAINMPQNAGLPFRGTCALAIGTCSTLPSIEPRPASSAITGTAATRLGRVLLPIAASHPGQSGLYPLLDGLDAFAARVLLARQAERALDVQYYIWRYDLSGTLLFEELRNAADRGVRVRLLLDDNKTSGLERRQVDSNACSRNSTAIRISNFAFGWAPQLLCAVPYRLLRLRAVAFCATRRTTVAREIIDSPLPADTRQSNE